MSDKIRIMGKEVYVKPLPIGLSKGLAKLVTPVVEDIGQGGKLKGDEDVQIANLILDIAYELLSFYDVIKKADTSKEEVEQAVSYDEVEALIRAQMTQGDALLLNKLRMVIKIIDTSNTLMNEMVETDAGDFIKKVSAITGENIPPILTTE